MNLLLTSVDLYFSLVLLVLWENFLLWKKVYLDNQITHSLYSNSLDV